jgi:hypothetical protein
MVVLKEKIELRFGRKILFYNDCIELSDHIFQNIAIRISPQTLRRIFNFINDSVKPSLRTLNLLSQYCGYIDLDELEAHSTDTSISDSISSSQIIKLFYQIEQLNEQDINYHTAAGNIAKVILHSPKLIDELQHFISKNSISQIYFFERYPYIDAVSTLNYRKLIKLYLQEKKDTSAQLFGHCLLHLGSVLSLDFKSSKSLLSQINKIGFKEHFHPFLQARYIMANLLQAYIENQSRNLDYFKNLAFEVEKRQSRGKEPGVIFPYFQYILADAFNLIQDYEAAYKMIQICDLDYNRIAVGKIANGYFDALDLMKAICIGNLDRKEAANRILNRLQAQDIIFIQHDYFLIQRYLLELNFSTARKNKQLENKINLIKKKTKFKFFHKIN